MAQKPKVGSIYKCGQQLIEISPAREGVYVKWLTGEWASQRFLNLANTISDSWEEVDTIYELIDLYYGSR